MPPATMRPVGLDRAHRHVELMRDVGVGVAQGDEAQNGHFALGQLPTRPHGPARRRRAEQRRTQPEVHVLPRFRPWRTEPIALPPAP